MKYQFMPMFWGDFFANTLHLSAQEVGAYVLLIGHAWENGGTIRVDRAQRIARVDNRHWQTVRAVLEPFFDIEAATEALPRRYVCRRVLREHAKAAELSNKRKGAAEQMLSKRGSKTAAIAPANDPPSTTTTTIETSFFPTAARESAKRKKKIIKAESARSLATARTGSARFANGPLVSASPSLEEIVKAKGWVKR